MLSGAASARPRLCTTPTVWPDTEFGGDLRDRRALGVRVERDRVTLELFVVVLPCYQVGSCRFPQSINGIGRVQHTGSRAPSDQIAHRKRRGTQGGRPPALDAEDYKGRNVVERNFNAVKNGADLPAATTTSRSSTAKQQSCAPSHSDYGIYQNDRVRSIVRDGRSGQHAVERKSFNAYTNVVSLGARLTKVVRKAVLAYSIRNRQRKAADILGWLDGQGIKDILFVGTMGDEHAGNSDMANAGIVEKRLAETYEVKMSINIEPAVTSYPFMIADARDMPFEDDYVDFALANAIIEHVGQEAEQRQMVNEMTRVARTWVITTPNKWFPVESHTSAILLHWLPSWRKKHEQDFSRLLSRRQFRALLPDGATLSGSSWSPTFTARYVKSSQ